MADEATDTTVQGGDPSPAGEVTPPANQDEREANADAQDTGVNGDPTPEDAEGAEDSEGAEKDPTKRMQRRIDRLTARNKGYEEQMAKLREELDGLKGEREKRELEDLRGLPVMPEALTREERKEAKDLLPQLDQARGDADWWFKHAEEGCTLKNGQELTGAQCLELGRRKERDAARLEARLDALKDAGRGRLAALLKKHGAEILAGAEPGHQDSPEPPRQAQPAAPKTTKPKPAPERAPGGGSAPSGKDGAGNAPPPQLSQEDLRRLWAD